LGEAAREHVSVVFGMGRFVDEWAALYEALASAKGVLTAPPQPITTGGAE
jgi:hypothetical protein